MNSNFRSSWTKSASPRAVASKNSSRLKGLININKRLDEYPLYIEKKRIQMKNPTIEELNPAVNY